MKSKLLIVTSLFMGGSAFAQITVTETDVAEPAEMVIQSHDTLPTVAVPSSGANQTWDYSTGLTEYYSDTIAFAVPSWLNNSGYFPSSNLAATMQGMEIYFINDATSLRILGMAGDIFGTGTDKQFFVNPPEEILRFPANYNDSYSTSSVQKVVFTGAELGVPADSIVSKSYKTKDITIDGWGSLTTPYTTFNVLRVNEVAYTTDSTWAYAFGMENLVDNSADTSYSIAFWSDDAAADFPVMEMSHDNMGNPYSVSWLKSAPSVAVEEIQATEVKIYPNPVSEILTMEFAGEEVVSVRIYSAAGAVVATSDVKYMGTTIDVSGMEHGIYFYEALNNANEVVAKDKFIVE